MLKWNTVGSASTGLGYGTANSLSAFWLSMMTNGNFAVQTMSTPSETVTNTNVLGFWVVISVNLRADHSFDIWMDDHIVQSNSFSGFVTSQGGYLAMGTGVCAL